MFTQPLDPLRISLVQVLPGSCMSDDFGPMARGHGFGILATIPVDQMDPPPDLQDLTNKLNLTKITSILGLMEALR
jgi:hypothetical protein